MPKGKVDWIQCHGCGTCVDTCLTRVFELQKLTGYADSKKSNPVRADNCIPFMTCETSFPTVTITVEDHKNGVNR